VRQVRAVSRAALALYVTQVGRGGAPNDRPEAAWVRKSLLFAEQPRHGVAAVVRTSSVLHGADPAPREGRRELRIAKAKRRRPPRSFQVRLSKQFIYRPRRECCEKINSTYSPYLAMTRTL
jgi:hypothetical protein